MGNMHSLLDNLVATGSLYGWRIDAILLGGLLWAATAGYSQLRLAVH